jgi:hypothetical protein
LIPSPEELVMTDDPHRISLKQAVELTAAHRKRGPDEVRGWRFTRSAFEALLKEPGMTGIRIYLGLDSQGPTLVMVATDADGCDLVDGYIAEEGWPCPPGCDRSSPLTG